MLKSARGAEMEMEMEVTEERELGVREPKTRRPTASEPEKVPASRVPSFVLVMTARLPGNCAPELKCGHADPFLWLQLFTF